jgi:hypothetical protein
MAKPQSRIKRWLVIGLGYGVGAAVGSIILLVLKWGQINSLPIFFVTLLAMWMVA